MTDPGPHRALDLDAFWMPLTSNRAFKQAPRLVVAAKDMHFTTADGRQVLDGLATLWCVNAGHCRPRIAEAIARQAATLDFSSSYSVGHPLAFEAARRVVELAPEGFGQVFFTNSGSEAVETALKIALAYHRLKGEATRTRFVGRERAFHGANFGGISVGGVPAYRKAFAAALLPGTDHLRHTQDLASRAFVRGEPPPARSSPTSSSSGSSRSTTRRTSRRSSSSRSRARAACSSRRAGISPGCGRSATATGSCSSSTR